MLSDLIPLCPFRYILHDFKCVPDQENNIYGRQIKVLISCSSLDFRLWAHSELPIYDHQITGSVSYDLLNRNAPKCTLLYQFTPSDAKGFTCQGKP